MFVCPPVHLDKHVNVGHYVQTLQLDFVIPTMPTGTVDFYHFVPVFVAWPPLRASKYRRSKTCFVFSHISQLISMKLNMMLDHFGLNNATLFHSYTVIDVNMGNNWTLDMILDQCSG